MQALVSRQRVGHASGVAAPLHVVLAPERRDAGTGKTQLTRNQRQIEQRVNVGGAVGVLGEAHSPYQTRAAMTGIGAPVSRDWRTRRHARAGANIVCRHAGYRRYPFGSVLVDDSPPLVVAFGTLTDESIVGQAFGDYDVRHGIEQGHVRSRVRT